MKAFVIALILCASASAASFSLDPVALVRAAKLPQASKLHKFVYVAEGIAAAASLGADGYTTERAIHTPGLHETNALFLTGAGSYDHFDQWKFWSYKVTFAAVPFLVTWGAHKLGGESTLSDGISIATAGVTTGLFTYAAVHNARLEK